MKLDDLEKLLQADIGDAIDPNDMQALAKFAAKIPKLTVKYQVLSGRLKIDLRNTKRALDKLTQKKIDILKNKTVVTKETLDEHFPDCDTHMLLNTSRTKSETEKLIGTLPDIQELQDQIEELEMVLEVVDSHTKQFAKSGFDIKNRIDLFKINSGGLL